MPSAGNDAQSPTPSVNARILYWGIPQSGKSSNLDTVFSKLRPENRGELKQVPTRLDPTVSYEILPIALGEMAGVRTQIELVTVPSGPEHIPTRKQLLDGVGGVVLVLDSRPEHREANVRALKELRQSLTAYGERIEDLPVVLQYNKRDLCEAEDVETLHRALALPSASVFEAVANEGRGVLPTLTTISKRVVRLLRDRADAEAGTSFHAISQHGLNPVAPVAPVEAVVETEPDAPTLGTEPAALVEPVTSEVAPEAAAPRANPVPETLILTPEAATAMRKGLAAANPIVAEPAPALDTPAADDDLLEIDVDLDELEIPAAPVETEGTEAAEAPVEPQEVLAADELDDAPIALGSPLPEVTATPEVAAATEPDDLDDTPLEVSAEPAPQAAVPVIEIEAETDPVGAAAEPLVADFEPVRLEPEPVLADIEPVVAEPEPVLADIEPVGAEPEPVLADIEPVGAEPEPVLADIEPVGAEPEPVLADIEPVGAEPEPEEPEALVAEATEAVAITSDDAPLADEEDLVAPEPAAIEIAPVAEPDEPIALEAEPVALAEAAAAEPEPASEGEAADADDHASEQIADEAVEIAAEAPEIDDPDASSWPELDVEPIAVPAQHDPVAASIAPDFAASQEVDFEVVEPANEVADLTELTPHAPSSPTSWMEEAILSEAEAAAREATMLDALANETETAFDQSFDSIAKESEGAFIGADLAIVSVGEAERTGARGLRIPLVLGNEQGETVSVGLSISLDPLIDEDA